MQSFTDADDRIRRRELELLVHPGLLPRLTGMQPLGAPARSGESDRLRPGLDGRISNITWGTDACASGTDACAS